MTDPNYQPTIPTLVQPPQKPKRPKTLLFGLAGIVALVLGCCGGAALLSNEADKPDGDKTVATAPASGGGAPVAAPQKPKYHTPHPQEFTLTVKVLEKQCFGSAGCNLQYRISKVTYIGEKMDPDKTYEISYKVTGLDDPKEGTFVMTGDGEYTVQSLEFGQTSSSGKTPKATVTAVELV